MARRAGWCAAIHRLLPAILIAVALVVPHPTAAQPVKGEVSAVADGGYARLVFRFAEEVDAQVRVANNVLIVNFARPVDVSVERISASIAGYVIAARRDPDGKAIRLALARKVTMNSMTAGERLFVDLMPDTWTGLAPGLPRDVIEELARRARDAEKKLRQQRGVVRQNKLAPIRVRVAVQPTFTRYVFELPELIGVSADNTKDKLTLTFDGQLKFDLADAKATLPATVEAIDSELDQNAAWVRFSFAGKVDLRTFREDNSYVVDVTEAKVPRPDGTVRSDEFGALAAELAARAGAPPAGVEPPQTVPARPTPGAAPADMRPPVPSPAPPPDQPAVVSPPVERQIPPPVTAPPVRAADATAAKPASDPNGQVSSGQVSNAQVNVTLKRQGDNLTLRFPFAEPTSAAVFRRADTLWLIFDTEALIALKALETEPSGAIKSVLQTRRGDVAIVRIKLERPRLASVSTDGPVWTVTLGTEAAEPTGPLAISRNIAAPARSSVTIPIDNPRQLHRLEDPDAGDALLVVTALAPARGIVKTQDFVEFRALATTHGVVLQPLADDLNAELADNKVVITRPAGLTLSDADGAGEPVYRRYVLDAQSWAFDREADFGERKSELIQAAATAPEGRRLPARLDLARFYLARDMAVEAKAVLDLALAANAPSAEDSTPLVLHAIACIFAGRPEQALKDLAHPTVGNQHDAPLWRSLASARLNKWADAREGFRNVDSAMVALPLELQRAMMKEMTRAFIEVGDITGGVNQMHEFETIGITRELEPAVSVLAGRIAEGLGRPMDALRAYQTSADSWDRPAAAQGRLREIVLRHSLGHLRRAEAIGNLETLTAIWRGDETEIEALQLLMRLYAEESRYRDAFHIARTALKAHPNSELTRRMQDEAAATFDTLFLGGNGDALPAIEALALFYDYRELTPIGRRGDEMIRRLADRLVSVDLLDQAAELLQHQVDHRLQGAARAQVATRLAVIYLMNRKVDRTLATLRATRTGDLSNELRNQRLLIEARALSDSGRHDVALEVIGNITGREAIRLRSDILWAGRHWSEAAEQIELIYGDRWQDFEPLTETERADVLRAAIGFALGEDAIGLLRFREKYAAKIGDGPDRRAFDVITAPIGSSGGEFREIVRTVAAVDTLDAFLRDLRERYPETGALPAAQLRTPASPSEPPKGEPSTTGTAAPRRPIAAASPAR
jgi:tetratricopeptide (TPR) repeat protein